MKPRLTVEAMCPPVAEVDAWAARAFVTRAIPDLSLALHLLACSHCRRRAAISWALLPDPPYATMEDVPESNLSFLPLRVERP